MDTLFTHPTWHAGCFISDFGEDLSQTDVHFDDNVAMADLNDTFELSITTTPTNDAYPRSYVPLYFTSNPTSASTKGLSLGHGTSRGSVEVRMSDGSTLGVKTYALSHQGPVNEATTYKFGCTKSATGRDCTFSANGVASTSGTQSFAVTGEIYNSDGGKFGNVWGWRFIGTLGPMAVCPDPASAGVHLFTSYYAHGRPACFIKLHEHQVVDTVSIFS